MGNLAKIPPQQVFADLGRGSYVESGSAWCRAGIIERFEKFKMATKMAAKKTFEFENDIKTLFFDQILIVIHQSVCFYGQGIK